MEPIKACALELRQSCRDDATELCQPSIELLLEPDVEAVRHKMSSAEASRIVNQLIDRQPNGGVVRRDDRSSARADDDVDRNAVTDEPLQDAEVAGAAQATTTQDETDTNWRPHVMLPGYRLRAHRRQALRRVYERDKTIAECPEEAEI
jgi:hypothetical protein